MSFCLTFESERDYSGTEFRGAISKQGKKIKIRACVFTFPVKLEKWSFDVTNSPRKRKKCTEIKKQHVRGVQSSCFCSLNMQNLWRCCCRRVEDFTLPILGSATLWQIGFERFTIKLKVAFETMDGQLISLSLKSCSAGLSTVLLLVYTRPGWSTMKSD